jgi:hypothetical protein
LANAEGLKKALNFKKPLVQDLRRLSHTKLLLPELYKA